MPRPPSVCDYCLLRAVAAGDAPVSSTTEIVGRAGLSREGARLRLRALAADGLLHETIKGQTALWYLSLSGHQTISDKCDCGTDLLLGER